MTLFTLSPLTKKRLERFRRSRVAFWSLCLLCLIYVLSLCAELLCNGKPLMMRFDGETYFPFLRELPPQAVLDATGERVYVNYREFVHSEVFTQNPDNYAIFAPIPYSPDETLDTKDLERDKIVTLTLVPTQPVGRFNLTQDLAIVRQDNCLQFFPKQTSSRDLRDGQISLYDFIDVTPKLADEIARRIGGEDLGPYETTVAPAAGHDLPWKRLSLTLAPTAIGEGSTRTLRVTLRLADGERFLPTRTFAFTRDFDDDGRPGELRFLPEQSDSQPDDKLLLRPRRHPRHLRSPPLGERRGQAHPLRHRPHHRHPRPRPAPRQGRRTGHPRLSQLGSRRRDPQGPHPGLRRPPRPRLPAGHTRHPRPPSPRALGNGRQARRCRPP